MQTIVVADAEDDEQDLLEAQLDVDGEPITLIGRIDRIDYHEQLGALRIIDYKTADQAENPDKVHRSEGRWVDLQLPLYRRLWPAAPAALPAVSGNVQLGYFNLPSSAREAGWLMADWDEATLAEAEESARGVVRHLRQQIYWPPVSPAPDYAADFASICLDNVFGPPPLGNGETGIVE